MPLAGALDWHGRAPQEAAPDKGMQQSLPQRISFPKPGSTGARRSVCALLQQQEGIDDWSGKHLHHVVLCVCQIAMP